MTFFSHLFFLLLFHPFLFASFSYGATLQDNEVEALKDIGKTLGKKEWDFNVDPCNWRTSIEVGGAQNAVTCNCSFQDNTVCHVVSVVLKAQNLSGTPPPEFVKLPFLQEIDLTLNYLNGTIPKEWATLNLVNISFYGNRLTGPIPKELGSITTLKSLVLEFNQLSGSLPPELGNLPQIERLLLTSNNFTGELPATFASLTTLKHFRIGSNQFSGTIPNFIQRWTNLEMLVMQGSGLSGPVPSGISLLENLTDLTISDLNGSDSPFPLLNNLTNLKKLVLRSCNIVGAVPEYLGNFTNLTVIDLSYNKLTGQIPMSFDGLNNLYMLVLSRNLLSGPLPSWIDKPDFVDLSYNNFSIKNIEQQQTCQQGSVNLFASSMDGNSLGNISCLANYHCPKTLYSLYINCGGKLVISNGSKTYDDDSSEMGPARFRQTGMNWAVITAGHFFDSGRSDYYTWSNTTKLLMDNAELYMDARVSPNTLTYYGFCLGNGNYTVNLHFAEIMFTNDETYYSLGRRVFDIYIQRKLVVKDFNIAKEAGGVGKPVIKKFTVAVTSNALEIRLYWAGKGTTTIPFGSVYGPLISAISVDSDFTPQSESGSSISAGVVVAIVAAGAIFIIFVFGMLWWKGCLGLKSSVAKGDLKGLSSQSGVFTLRQIKAATNNFDESFKIGKGGFGPVYKGILSDGTVVAVKQLSSKSRQGNREFVNEIGMISALKHPNLVKLHGFCVEEDQLLLIYEYMENNSLAHTLFVTKEDPGNRHLRLDWKTRQRICVGIAKGLAYLHEESRLKIVHRDIKATNVLLDQDLNPKISDFGLAKLKEEDSTHIDTRIAGTYSQVDLLHSMAEQDIYIKWGHATIKIYKEINLQVLNQTEGESRRNGKVACLLNWTTGGHCRDLSYNNFSIKNIEQQQTCQQGSVNLFASSMDGNSLGNISCLANYHCPKTLYSLYINCGGKLVISNGSKTYDDDSSEMGPARFRQTGMNWAVITAGHFFDSGRSDYYTWSNTTKLLMDNAELYMDARVSPNTLTYYGFCLGNGNYTVNLHFAEIMFTNDETYYSLGRRVFDIYIQRKLVVKDFNIAKEAGGVGKPVIKKFTVAVTSNALEIRLYWAGKGTTTIPFGSVYGPLISAISVDSDFTPQSESGSSISAGVVVAIVAAGAIFIIFVFGMLWWKGCLGLKSSVAKDLKGLSSQSGVFTLRQIKAATNNFDESFKIGKGGFGPVYKGILSDGTVVAVKQLSSKSRQGNREFVNEIGMISALKHPNLVKLHGFCVEEDQLLLIYEYMENNSLAHTLFVTKEDPGNRHLRLDWKTRQRICVGIAKGLAYLHEESRLKIVHRDIKATNVLLDQDLNPKISDFGLAKLKEEDSTHIDTRIAGTYGYMAPEYAMHGYLTDKADVYSFGIVALEIVSGANSAVSHPQEECFSLLDWALVLKERDNVMELVDKRLGEDFNEREVVVMIKVALLCTKFSPALRPTMSSVVSMLEGRRVLEEIVSDRSMVLDDKKFEVMKNYYQHKRETDITGDQSQNIPTDESNAFISTDIDSSYLETRN
ncbi:PREDICTED: probable leucine-rich repeat receptor-like serine/threonine-protein kinase At3g14840 [Lupinus angustifolius]|uniref:probable leucine-rich repeat receptor-like serine/threonine-protein kinase At3g14840 n=1 Tax=Lupinus angustifolius TaxID=3871 RepID=UPI00092F9D6C|nr:PREDICTED: probable leucine-rich repeat receptor-like serine/threonine-protein kinase At3g14840 [Lupinus angustifolius]